MDKRFWTGALATMTVVVAGASALPALLLAPSTPEPMIAAVAPAAPKPAPFRNVVAEIPAPVRVPPRQVEPATPAPGIAQPVAAAPAAPVVAPAPPALVVAVQPPPAPPPAPVAAAQPAPPAETTAFPPVQPVGVATGTENAPAVAPAPDASRAVSATKPAREVRVREARASPRRVRPAVYPIREFLAWRR